MPDNRAAVAKGAGVPEDSVAEEVASAAAVEVAEEREASAAKAVEVVVPAAVDDAKPNCLRISGVAS